MIWGILCFWHRCRRPTHAISRLPHSTWFTDISFVRPKFCPILPLFIYRVGGGSRSQPIGLPKTRFKANRASANWAPGKLTPGKLSPGKSGPWKIRQSVQCTNVEKQIHNFTNTQILHIMISWYWIYSTKKWGNMLILEYVYSRKWTQTPSNWHIFPNCWQWISKTNI